MYLLDINVTEAKNLLNCDVLIGMDIITIGDFTITKENNCTVFSFRYPSSPKHIDFVADLNKIKQEEIKEKNKKNRSDYNKKRKRRPRKKRKKR